MDFSVADTDETVRVDVEAPDGSTHGISLGWGCVGGGGSFRWESRVDLTGMDVPRAGTWQLDFELTPVDDVSTLRSIESIWMSWTANEAR